jgi:hypothetical protein
MGTTYKASNHCRLRARMQIRNPELEAVNRVLVGMCGRMYFATVDIVDKVVRCEHETRLGLTRFSEFGQKYFSLYNSHWAKPLKERFCLTDPRLVIGEAGCRRVVKIEPIDRDSSRKTLFLPIAC